MKTAWTTAVALCVLALSGGFSPTLAQSGGCVEGKQAREVLEKGQAAPLPTAMQNAGLHGAQVLSAQLCKAGGGWSYKVRYRQGGQVRSTSIPAG
jgi:hypothetical protein